MGLCMCSPFSASGDGHARILVVGDEGDHKVRYNFLCEVLPVFVLALHDYARKDR